MLAQNYSEDPNTRAQRRRYGIRSRVRTGEGQPRTAQAGGVAASRAASSPVIHTQEGYRILKVISREPAGQRELNDPRVQQNIRETLLNRKDQLLKPPTTKWRATRPRWRTTWPAASCRTPASRIPGGFRPQRTRDDGLPYRFLCPER